MPLKKHHTAKTITTPFAALAVIIFCTHLAAAAVLSVPTMSVDELKPGMEGYGLTVLQGAEPVKMPVRIIGVLKKANAGGDLILARLLGEEYEHIGVAAGMSGSPIYIDGKLIGALSYGWSFTKDPICGITPIADMARHLDEPDSPPVRRASAHFLWPSDGSRPTPDSQLKSLLGGGPPATFYTLPVRHSEIGDGELIPIATPITVSGFTPTARTILQNLLERESGAPVVVGGASGSAGPDPAADNLQPGSTISIPLMIGDMEAAAIGTVTYRDGDTILAFGHPMFNDGASELPMGGGVIHHVMAGIASSFKMGDPTSILGTLVLDKQFAIKCKLGEAPAMVPVTVTVRESETGAEVVSRMQIVNNENITVPLMYSALYNTVARLTGDSGKASAHVNISARIKDYPQTINFKDMYFSQDLFFIDALGPLAALNYNPFKRIEFESVDIVMTIEREVHMDYILGVSMDRDRVHPGDEVTLNVLMQHFNGSTDIMPVHVSIPDDAPLGAYRFLVISGMERGPIEEAPHETFEQYVETIRDWCPNNSLVIITYYPEKAPAVGGYELMNTPASMRDSVFMGNYSGLLLLDKQDRLLVPTENIIVGQQVISFFLESELQQ